MIRRPPRYTRRLSSAASDVYKRQADKQSILNNISKVSNAPGIVINPGQLSYGLQMLAAGKDIDYQGATDVEFNAFGDAAGAFKELEVSGGEFVTVGAL